MKVIHNLAEQIHARALEAVSHYKKTEAELLEVLQLAEKHQVYRSRGHTSLYYYAVKELGLSENVAYCFITVSRKATEVPELKSQIQTGTMTLTNARRVAAVLTPRKPIRVDRESLYPFQSGARERNRQSTSSRGDT